MRRFALALVVSMVGVGVAAAQEAGPEVDELDPGPGDGGGDTLAEGPEGDYLEPLPDEEDDDRGRPSWVWPTDGQIQLRLVYDDLRLDLDVEHVKGTGAPTGTRTARRRIDYECRHTSARIEGAYGLSLDRDISLDVRAGLGWGTSTITVESKTASVLSGGGPNVETNLESTVDLNISFGVDLRWRFGKMMFCGLTYQLVYGFGTFDDQVMYSVVDGQIHYMTHDIMAVFGVTLHDVLSVWAGAGAVVYWNSINLDQLGGTDRWHINLEEDSLFKAALGLALHHGPLAAWVQFQFVPKPSLGVGIGYTF